MPDVGLPGSVSVMPGPAATPGSFGASPAGPPGSLLAAPVPDGVGTTTTRLPPGAAPPKRAVVVVPEPPCSASRVVAGWSSLVERAIVATITDAAKLDRERPHSAASPHLSLDHREALPRRGLRAVVRGRHVRARRESCGRAPHSSGSSDKVLPRLRRAFAS